MPAARKVSGMPVRRAVVRQRGDLRGVGGEHHRLRQQPVQAGVGREADEVDGPGEHPVAGHESPEIGGECRRSTARDRRRGQVPPGCQR